MKTAFLASLVWMLILAGLYGCGSTRSAGMPITYTVHAPASRTSGDATPSTLDAYKTAVAQHVVAHNPAHTFSGRLPPMLPAIVVLNITVDRSGHMTHVVVQRSRDPDASKVALASMERSGTLPPPSHLIAANGHSLTFSETFLFNDAYRFQLRSIAGPQ